MAKQNEERRDLNVTGAHQELPDTSEALSDEIILLKINSALKELGDSAKYIKAPKYDQQIIANLAGQKIVMVDDRVRQLTTWMPQFIAATQGSASYVLHNHQSLEQLVQEIVNKSPDVVLLDYELSCGLKGIDVLPLLRERIPTAIIIGFSSLDNYNLRFLKAGVDGVLDKGATYNATEIVSNLGDIIGNSVSSKNADLIKSHEEIKQQADKNKIDLKEIVNQTLTDQDINNLVSMLSRYVELKDGSSHQEGSTYEVYRDIIDRLTAKCSSPFEKLMVIASEQLYHDEDARLKFYIDDEYYQITMAALNNLKGLLPECIFKVIRDDLLVSSATNGREFTLLFHCENESKRRIVTLDKLIELHDVYGYKYMNISPSGEPFVRCVTSRHGGRAFFDGTHLMSHPSFQTCAPKVSFFDGGYIVNSTGCTIVNGRIYRVINEQDKVALTTGAWRGTADFSNSEALDSYAKNDQLASKIKIGPDGTISLDDKTITPIGKFSPSVTRVLDNGFTLYEWAEFEKF